MVLKKLLPYGVKDYYPYESEKLTKLLKVVEKELTLWGYSEIGLPHLEFKKLFETTLGESKRIFPVGVWEGEELALRFDFTPQILRFVFHQKRELFPLRVYYKGKVFKKDGQLWEEPTLGFELVGASGVEADAEIVALTSQILSKLGLKKYLLLLGHRKIYDHLAEQFGKETVESKNFEELPKEFLRVYNLSKDDWKSLPVPKEVTEELEKLYNLFREYQIDAEIGFLPTLTPKRDYYSGIFFKVLVGKETIAGGGRYDNLFKRFGKNITATGGGLKLLKLLETVRIESEKTLKVFVIDTTPQKVEGWKIAKLLREKGFITARDLVGRDVKESLKVAELKNYDLAVVAKFSDQRVVREIVSLKKEINREKLKHLEELL